MTGNLSNTKSSSLRSEIAKNMAGTVQCLVMHWYIVGGKGNFPTAQTSSGRARFQCFGLYHWVLPYNIGVAVPCKLETSRSLQTAPCSLQTARWPCSLQTACHAVCRLRGHRFNELHARVCFGEITSKKTERIVMIL